MAEVEFSNSAELDLVEIDEFSVEQFGERVAETYMHGFDAAFDRLRDHPLVAPLRSEFGVGIRCLVHRQHRVLYTVTGEKVLIVRIIHHSRDARRALGDSGASAT